MFGNTTRHMPYVRNYEEAEKQFNKRGAVRSAKWAAHERPVYKTYHHYRVVKHDEYYDLVLYHTVMARYFTPQTIDGKLHERRLYMGDQSITSRDFMYHVLGVSQGKREILADENKVVIAPIYHRSLLHHDGEPFSADYHYVGGVLDTTKSMHTKHYRKVSSKEDRAERAEVIKLFEPYIMLAQMRMPEFHNNAEVTRNTGSPFSRGNERRYQDSVCEMAEGSTDQIAINHFFEMCEDAYTTLASKRAYKQHDFHMGSSYHKRPADSIDKLEKQITPPEFRTAIIGRINRLTGRDQRSEAVEIPQFVVESEYPRTNIVFG
jgi:hypothetical protein